MYYSIQMNELFCDFLQKYMLSVSEILEADLIPELQNMIRKQIIYDASLKCFKYRTFHFNHLFEKDCDERRMNSEWDNNEFVIEFNHRPTHSGRRSKAEINHLKYRLASAIKFNILLLEKLYGKFNADFFTQLQIEDLNTIKLTFWNDRKNEYILNDINGNGYRYEPNLLISIHVD